MQNFEQQLNRSMRAAKDVNLGTLCVELITKLNLAIARMNSVMLTKAGLAIKAGASPVVKAVSAWAAVVDGVIVRKAANTDMAALVGTLATAKSAVWAFYVSSAGTLSTSAKSADVNTHDLAIAALPVTPTNRALIGFVVIDNATGSNFVGGTTALDTGSLTVTYYDSTGLPPGLTGLGLTALADIQSRR